MWNPVHSTAEANKDIKDIVENLRKLAVTGFTTTAAVKINQEY